MKLRSDHYDKTQNEILEERAEVLGRAGEALSNALQNLQLIEVRIEAAMTKSMTGEESRRHLNREIQKFNSAREHAKLRLYYLIVTREPIGFRKHTSVEEAYPIPPRKKPVMRME